jgi:Ca2+-binding EF-hand superfamily protein
MSPAEAAAISTDELVLSFREKLLSRGARGIIGLSRQFRIMDDNDNKTLEFPEFVKAVMDYRISIPQSELQRVFDAFDRDGSGTIDYDEFIRIIRGGMNDFRMNLVRQAFTLLDKTGDGVLAIEDIKNVYNPRNHPDVRMGKKTEEEVLGEFLSTFETHHSILKGGAGLHQRVTWEEFVEYYENVSCSVDDDRYFELMMKNAWNFEGKTFEQGWTQDHTEGPSRKKYF